MFRTVENSISFATWIFLLTAATPQAQDEIVVLGGEGRHCGEDPDCINALKGWDPTSLGERTVWKFVHREGRISSTLTLGFLPPDRVARWSTNESPTPEGMGLSSRS